METNNKSIKKILVVLQQNFILYTTSFVGQQSNKIFMTVLNDKKKQTITKIRDGKYHCGPEKGVFFNILQCYFIQLTVNVSFKCLGASAPQRKHPFKVEFLQ